MYEIARKRYETSNFNFKKSYLILSRKKIFTNEISNAENKFI